jgi:hypothetical protein
MNISRRSFSAIVSVRDLIVRVELEMTRESEA